MDKIIIQEKIFEVNGFRVMLDFDLAELYGVPTRTLNQAVKRNLERFPKDAFANRERIGFKPGKS